MALFSKPEVVIVKESSDAKQYLEKLEELLPKTTGELREKIEQEMYIAKAGIVGEDTILFELKNSGMDMYVLHDVYIETDDLSAQIDYYIITPWLNFVLECKNLIGNIEIDSKGNFIRTIEFKGKKKKEGIYSPITQNERHMNVLKHRRLSGQGLVGRMTVNQFFDRYHKPLVVLANPKTVVNDRYAKKEVKNKVVRADQLITVIKQMCKECKEMRTSKKDMKEMAEEMLSWNVEDRKDYFAKYQQIYEEVESARCFEEDAVKLQLISEDNAVVENLRVCPNCGAKLVERKGKYGEFLGCSGFPKCRYTQKI
ncbi:MAG: NERD domain-containing protein [Lachnospiraceae bacterium]|nr:NERD domain-containing protein [Lachnospiraceae bacterium]